MTAYNFHSRFDHPIFCGDKTHTFRRIGNRRHARRGEHVQLYFGQRTAHVRKIIIDDPICRAVDPASFVVGADSFEAILIGGKKIAKSSWNALAVSDGFTDIDDMHFYWLAHRGPGTFDDYLKISWTPPDVPERPKTCGHTSDKGKNILCTCCDSKCLCGCRLQCKAYHIRYKDFSRRRSARIKALRESKKLRKQKVAK